MSSAWKSRSTVHSPSPTSASTLMAAQQPDSRLRATPYIPKAMSSSPLRGVSTGMPKEARVRSLVHGTLEDLAAGSSPAITSTPPLALAP
jgi:hypothetical protein